MSFTTSISVSELSKHIGDSAWIIVDSRFTLANPAQGRLDYEIAHIPGAVYAHLDQDLSGHIIKGVTGRHPLPDVKDVTKVFSRFGINSRVQVVAYDAVGGALAAGRVWWMLRWLGHESVALLNGGWQEWIKNGLAVRSGNETNQARRFIPHPRNDQIVSAEDLDAIRKNPQYRILDARAADRFHGENETIDPVAGHIPGAISVPYAGNLNPDGTFQSKERLAARYRGVLSGVPIQHVVCYCGSGVTATHDILAIMMAGLGEARLYAGSYSEWITDPNRPVEK
jgi:thiosulfate/3-mercaptopyruvate sulfurtransferase